MSNQNERANMSKYTKEEIKLEQLLSIAANEEGTIQAHDMLRIAPHDRPELHTTMSVSLAFEAITGKEYDADDWRCFVIGLTRLSVIKLDDTPFTPLRREHTPPDLFHLHLSPHPRPNLPPRSARRCVPPGPCGVSLVTLFTAAGMQASLLPPCIREVDWRLRCGLMKPVRGFVIPALLTSVSFMPAQVVDLALPAASPGRGRGRCSGW